MLQSRFQHNLLMHLKIACFINSLVAILVFIGCSPSVDNPDVRSYLDTLTPTDTYDMAYGKLKEHFKIKTFSIKRGEMIPGFSHFTRKSFVEQPYFFELVGFAKGEKWSYEVTLYYSREKRLMAISYSMVTRKPFQEESPFVWTPNWRTSTGEN